MTADSRFLLILDLDETLLFASETLLDRHPERFVGPYFVYFRPHLVRFLRTCHEHFQIAIWSSSSVDYVDAIIREIFPREITPIFAWSRKRCTQRIDPECLGTYYVKDLKKVKRLGFNLDRVLIIEDIPKNAERNYGNAIFVKPFHGDPDDRELLQLLRYLT
jgi:RNA polymerase II subunit A small phosphatase-like protein